MAFLLHLDCPWHYQLGVRVMIDMSVVLIGICVALLTMLVLREFWFGY
jgi:hypothetical protein